MFQNVTSLVSVQFVKENKDNEEVYINSMISTFEGCEKLESFINKGFNTEQVTSIHKIFYESGLTQINFEEFLKIKNK